MATNNAVNVGLSGSTGTGNFVGATSPTLVTPILGAATATSLAFSPTTGGIIGTTAADSPTAGDVGEVLSAILLVGSAVSLTDLTAANITSISLTAGDWDVWGEIWFNAAGTTSTSSVAGAINTSSATFPTVPAVGTSVACIAYATATEASASVQQTLPIAPCQINISGTTTIYLNARAGFITSTMSAYGKIMARRRR